MKKFSLLLIAINIAIISFAEGKTAYGILAFDEEEVRKINSLVSFPLEGNFTTYEQIVQFGKTDVFSGAFAEGSYYAESIRNTGNVEVPDSLLKIDIATGKYIAVGPIEGFANDINDMSYDYSTSTMWAVAQNATNSYSELFTINLETAATTKKFTLDRRFFTLACTYDGELYAISFHGELCKINKTNGAVTVINKLSVTPNLAQSMEFDHTTGTLYWAAQVVTVDGYVEMEESFMATIDIATGNVTRLGNIGSSGQIVGLYIPFSASASDTPAAVSELTITPAENGLTQATLSWINPTTLFGGEELTEITGISIYRNDQLVTTLQGNPGEKSTYIDNIGNGFIGGTVSYRIIVTNANGNGAPTEKEAFIGLDIPAAPNNLQAKKESFDKVVLSWSAPTASVNGGWFNPQDVVYKVVRNNGTEIVANTNELTVSDQVTDYPQTCTYTVTAFNKAGEGGSAIIGNMVLGPQNTLPFTCDFNDNQAASQWTPIDADGDGNTWKYMNNADTHRLSMAYTPNNGAGEDYIASHIFGFEAGKTYEVKDQILIYGVFDFEFVLLSEGKTPISIQQYLQTSTQWQPAEITFSFSPAESGDYQLAVKSLSESGSYLWLLDINIEEKSKANLSSIAIDGDDSPAIGTASRYFVMVQNTGSTALSKYSVNLVDATTNEILSSAQNTEEIAVGEKKTFVINWTPTDKNITSIAGAIVCEEDGTTDDNRTQTFEINVQDTGAATTIKIGALSEESSQFSPFALYDSNSAALNIYTSEEIGRNNIIVKKIAYIGSCFMPKAFPAKIYMANTSRQTTNEGWIAEKDMTLVYDGDVTIDMNSNSSTDFTIEIPLSTNFEYTDGNLAVLTILNWEYDFLSGVSFRSYNRTDDAGCGIWYGSGTFDFTQEMKMSEKYNSSISLTVQDKGSSSINDLPTDSTISDKPRYYINGNTLFISDKSVKKVLFSDLSGRSILHTTETAINIATFRGAHILTVIYTDGSTKSEVIFL